MSEKQPMTAGKVIMIVVGVMFLLGLGTCATCAMCVGGAATQVAKDEQAKAFKVQETLKNCQNAEVVAWASVAAGLKDNEARVSAAWKGNCVKISGVVDSIDSDFNNKPVVRIGAGERFNLNNCHCEPEVPEKALSLSKGQKITVWGIGGNEIVGSLMLEHCSW